jgi:hypothetical protein
LLVERRKKIGIIDGRGGSPVNIFFRQISQTGVFGETTLHPESTFSMRPGIADDNANMCFKNTCDRNYWRDWE